MPHKYVLIHCDEGEAIEFFPSRAKAAQFALDELSREDVDIYVKVATTRPKRYPYRLTNLDGKKTKINI